MTYTLLRFAHVIGVTLMGAGLIGVWIADLRSRQVQDLVRFAEAVRSIAVFYDGVVVPGAVILFVSGTWMTAEAWGGWEFTQQPWLAGMILLFVIEFAEGNTITRLYFMRLRRLTNEALAQGASTTELSRARQEHLPTFTHFLDIPMLMVIISLGAIRPMTWTQFVIGTLCALAVATAAPDAGFAVRTLGALSAGPENKATVKTKAPTPASDKPARLQNPVMTPTPFAFGGATQALLCQKDNR